MKKVNEHRFKKQPEASSFRGTKMPDAPKNSSRAPVRTDVAMPVDASNQRLFEITIPTKKKRAVIRHAFQIYQDQLTSLKTIQLADRERTGDETTLADMARDALDAYIQRRVEQGNNLKFSSKTGYVSYIPRKAS